MPTVPTSDSTRTHSCSFVYFTSPGLGKSVSLSCLSRLGSLVKRSRNDSNCQRPSPHVHLQFRALSRQFRRNEAHGDTDAERGRVTTAADCTDRLSIAEDVAVTAHDASIDRFHAHQLTSDSP